MTNYGKTIKLSLKGNVTEIKFIELVNRTIQGWICPRSRISELKNWPESQKPGVYILFGEIAGEEAAYIGESENVFDRLKTHVAQSDFEFKEVVLFTGKDTNLTKGHVRCLESKLYFRAKSIIPNRIKVINAKEPSESPIPCSDEETILEFADNLYFIMGTLRYLLFEPQPMQAISQTKETTEGGNLSFDLPNLEVHATGQMTDEGFLVCKGSEAVLHAANSLQGGYRKLRDDLIKSETLKSNGEKLRFDKNYTFDSASAAATIVAGSPKNGNISWKDVSGKTLKEIETSKLSDSK